MNMIRFLVLTVILVFAQFSAAFASGNPILYKISVDASDLTGFNVEMQIPNSGATVRVAMAAHPEYDDRYWRYIENFAATDSRGRTLPVVREGAPVWRIEKAPRDLVVKYRLRLPAQTYAFRDAWKPFLTPTGGMVGDLHSLMYVVGGEWLPTRLTLDLPAGWSAASGLEPTKDRNVFTGSTELMLDAPVIIGSFREWKFNAGGVPHSVVLWSSPDAKPVDAAPIVDGIERLTNQAIRAFGPPPYPRYSFLFQDGGSAALEHATSLNVGLPTDLSDTFEEIAHEYVHVWNLMDVRPRERVGVRYRFAEPTNVLWWSEGATIMFADLLLRRAGVAGDPRPRLQRLESIIARYLSAPGYTSLSAELVSRGDSHPELLTTDFPSTHLQGEVLTTMLDFKIRDATDGRRNLTHVMRTLAERFSQRRGIVNQDIKAALEEACGCQVDDFFREHISNARRADFDRYLSAIGVRAEVNYATALAADGKPAVDLRVGPVSATSEMKVRITNSLSAWAKADLRTGDRVISADGKPTPGWQEFRNWLRTLKVGDVGRLVVERDGISKNIEVNLIAYTIPTVRLIELPGASPKQLRLRESWKNAN